MADEEEKGFFSRKKILAGGAGGVIGFTSVVFAYIDSKIDDVNLRLEESSSYVMKYVDARNTEIEKKLDKIENVLIRIDDRMYEIIKSQKNNKQGE